MSLEDQPLSWDDLQSMFRNGEGKVYTNLSTMNQFSVKQTRAANNAGQTEGNAAHDVGYWKTEFTRHQNTYHDSYRYLKTVQGRLETFANERTLTDIQSSFLRRAVNVLNDFPVDYNRCVQTSNASLVRLELFAGEYSSVEDGPNGDVEYLKKEQHSLLKGIEAVDEQIEMSRGSQKSLLRQRDIFSQTLLKLQNLGAYFPRVKTAMTSISRYQTRDTLVLALVTSVCMFLFVLYLSRGK